MCQRETESETELEGIDSCDLEEERDISTYMYERNENWRNGKSRIYALAILGNYC